MILLDGTIYQIASDGRVQKVEEEAMTPFSWVTFCRAAKQNESPQKQEAVRIILMASCYEKGGSQIVSIQASKRIATMNFRYPASDLPLEFPHDDQQITSTFCRLNCHFRFHLSVHSNQQPPRETNMSLETLTSESSLFKD